MPFNKRLIFEQLTSYKREASCHTHTHTKKIYQRQNSGKDSRSFWLWQLCCPLWFPQTNSLPIAESTNTLARLKLDPGSAFLFLECGGETVKGVLKVPECVSTEAVVLFYQVHNAVTASHCLLLTPFRYCSYLLFFHCSLSLSLYQSPTSNSLSDSSANTFSFLLHHLFPTCDRTQSVPIG